MARYKVYEVEDRMTAGGKALKKLVLQGEGKQYPDKNVTMWADHPLFEDIAVGQSVELEIEVKDSTTPNPKGGFYKNKTVKKEAGMQQRDSSPAAKDPGMAELKNILQLQVIAAIDKNFALINEVKFKVEALGDRLEKLINPPKEDDFEEPTDF
jgi:hypothetical protein